MQAATVADGAVTTAKLADDAVTPAKISTLGSTDGQVLTSTGPNSNPAWETVTGGGTGDITSITTTVGSGIGLAGCDTGDCAISLDIGGMTSVGLNLLTEDDEIIIHESNLDRRTTLGNISAYTFGRIVDQTDLAALADADSFVANDASEGTDDPREVTAARVSNYIGNRLAGAGLTYNTTTNQLDGGGAPQIELIDSLNDVTYTQADTADLSPRFGGGATVYVADIDAEGTADAEINDLIVFQWRDNPAAVPDDRALGIRINETGTTLPIRIIDPLTNSLTNKTVADLTRYEFLFLSRQDGVFIQMSSLALADVMTRLMPDGGTAGQVLTKDTATDFDVSWTTVAAGTDDQTAAEVPVTATGFDGSLSTNATNVQLALQEIDDLTITGTDDQTAAEVSLDTTAFNRLLDATDDTNVQALADAFDDLPGGIVQYSNSVTYVAAVQQLTAVVEIFTVNGDLLVLEMPSTLDDSADDLMLRTQVGVAVSATRAVTDVDGDAISPSDLVAERTYTLVHIGNNFQLIDPLPAAASGAGLLLQKHVVSSNTEVSRSNDTWTDLLTQSVTIAGATDRVFVDAAIFVEFLGGSGNEECDVRVTRDDTLVGAISGGRSYVQGEMHYVDLVVMDDSPGAGTYTYAVEGRRTATDVTTCNFQPDGTSSYATFEVLSANP